LFQDVIFLDLQVTIHFRKQLNILLETVKNHGNMEITGTVIFIKYRDSAKIPQYHILYKKYFVSNQHKLNFTV